MKVFVSEFSKKKLSLGKKKMFENCFKRCNKSKNLLVCPRSLQSEEKISNFTFNNIHENRVNKSRSRDGSWDGAVIKITSFKLR